MASGLLLFAGLLAATSAAAALRARAGRRRAEREREALRRRLEDVERTAREDRTRLEADARRARDAVACAERARDDLVAAVSHELRTPLNVVLGWARLLRSGKLDAAGTARALEAIERGASSQARIVDDLLDVARLARGELRLDLRTVELVPVVEAALAAIRPAAAARGLRLAVALEPCAGPVSGDPGRLQQVVWNLLCNAVKFTPEGGRVEVRLHAEGDAAVVRVSDTGEGLDPGFVPHLFERFRQGDASTTRAHGGIGAGLAIVREVVEAHGGTVSAHSDGPGKGATFTVRLPAIRRAGAGAGARTAAARES